MEEVKKVPEIRFGGFDRQWEKNELRHYGKVSMNKRIFKYQTSETGEIPFYKIGTFGKDPDAFISRDLFEEFKRAYDYPEVGDILISASGSIGRTVEYLGEDEYFQDSNIVWLKHNGSLDNSFLKQYYSFIKWAGLEGSTIKRLYNKNILDTEIVTPDLKEQNAIGDFFQNLDNLIKSHHTSLKKLTQLKKAMLVKLFPQDGATTPAIRFKGFDGEWERVKLGEYAYFRRGSFPQPYGNSDWYDGKDSQPFVQVVDVGFNLALVKNTKQRISLLAQPQSVFVKKGSVVVTLQGSIGRVAILDYDAYVDRTILIFESYKNLTDSRFWAYIIQQKFKTEEKMAPGGTIKTITKEVLANFEVTVTGFEEQQKIGNYFKNLDSLIDHHSTQLKKLNQIKKACLSKLFVQ